MIRKLKNLFHLLESFFANIFYGFPSKKLTIIGVTGTDGKTTTVHLIHHLLKSAGFKVGLISTVSAPGLHTTTPDPWILQKLLRDVVKKRLNYVVLEATSHGLDQHRLWGVRFQIGVITNITHEHLDYHHTYQNYLQAKAKLLRRVKVAVLNRDDRSYDYLMTKIQRPKTKIITYAIKNEADFTPTKFKFSTSLPGEYNRYNCLAGIAVASTLGINEDMIRKAVFSFKGVIGRMEEINEGQNFKVIVDFAHTPNALENILKTLNSQLARPERSRGVTCNQRTGKLIAVFGCAGLRDAEKRPIMGEISARLTDISILTAEDPRTEDVDGIIEEIAVGCKKAGGIEGKTFFRVPNRGKAIELAVKKVAKKGDILVICGKGHEKSMCYGKIEHPWSDQEQARKALKNLKYAKKK